MKAVGISVKGRPKVGIIHKPFYESHFGIKCSKTYLGSVECGVFFSEIKDYMDDEHLYSVERSFH